MSRRAAPKANTAAPSAEVSEWNAELQSYIAWLTDSVRRFTLERVAPHVKRTPWIPACAGMTIPTPVIPAEAGIQGSPKIMKDLAARQLGL